MYLNKAQQASMKQISPVLLVVVVSEIAKVKNININKLEIKES